MLMTGPTLRLGLYLAEKSHPILVLGINHILLALVVFISSYVKSMLIIRCFLWLLVWSIVWCKLHDSNDLM
jgi:hypothetical protein